MAPPPRLTYDAQNYESGGIKDAYGNYLPGTSDQYAMNDEGRLAKTGQQHTNFGNYRDEFSYGGSQAAFGQEQAYGQRRGSEWYNRDQDPFGIRTFVDFGRAEQARAMGQQARGEQQYGQEASMRVARGEGPSYAGARFTADLDAAALAQAGGMAQGTSFAGKPTGGGALSAQRAGTQGMTAAGGQYGAGVASETAAGRGAFQGGAESMRRQDVGQMGLDMAKQQALNDDFFRRRGLTDKMAAFYEAQNDAARRAQMGAMRDAFGVSARWAQAHNRWAEAAEAERSRREAALLQAGAGMVVNTVTGNYGGAVASAGKAAGEV